MNKNLFKSIALAWALAVTPSAHAAGQEQNLKILQIPEWCSVALDQEVEWKVYDIIFCVRKNPKWSQLSEIHGDFIAEISSNIITVLGTQIENNFGSLEDGEIMPLDESITLTKRSGNFTMTTSGGFKVQTPSNADCVQIDSAEWHLITRCKQWIDIKQQWYNNSDLCESVSVSSEIKLIYNRKEENFSKKNENFLCIDNEEKERT